LGLQPKLALNLKSSCLSSQMLQLQEKKIVKEEAMMNCIKGFWKMLEGPRFLA
jgi:hypothetical protein